MNRSRVIRRALTLAGATASAVAVTFAMAAPALACHPAISADCTASTDKDWTVTWTVVNEGQGKEGTVEAVSVQPAAELQKIKVGVKFASGDKLTDTQVISQDIASATLTVKLGWVGKPSEQRSVTYNRPKKCEPVPASPSPSVSPSTSPSAPASPPATPPATTAPPAPGGGGGLPVTGSAVGGIAGAAAVLLAIGGGLFIMARRRRIRFTA